MEEYINICNETNKQEMEDPKCNEYITMEELEGAIYILKKNLHQDQIFSSINFSSMEEQKLKENY